MPLFLFHGDNRLEISEAVRVTRRNFHGADVLTFDGVTAHLPALSEACLTAGLFDPERLVLVHNLHERLKGNRKEGGENEQIAQILGALAPTTTLVLACADMPVDHPLLRMVSTAGGEAKYYGMPRRGDLVRWISARGTLHDVEVDRDAAELLADLIGSNSIMLDSELEKLAIYAGEEKCISPAMVDTLVGAITQESIFALIDAVAAGNKAVAFRLLRAQVEQSSSSAIDVALYLIRMLARQFRILLRIRLGQEAGRSGQQISGELKIPRYYERRYFAQARRLSMDRLKRTFEQLAELEFALKNGEAEPATALDLLVAELSS